MSKLTNAGTIECPQCCHANEYDTDNDNLLCEECGLLIWIPDQENE